MLLAPPKTPGSSLRVQLVPLLRRESIHEIRLRALQPLLKGKRYLHSLNIARIGLRHAKRLFAGCVGAGFSLLLSSFAKGGALSDFCFSAA
jgi:hypothetical protein